MISKRRLEELLEGFSRRRIMVVGDLMLDHYIHGVAERISPEAPVPVVRVRSERFLPGGAGNVVRNLCALSTGVIAVGVVGDDREGEVLLKLLEEAGADVSGVMVDESRPTTTKTRVIAHNQHVVRIDREEREEVGEGLTEEILRFISGRIDEVDGVVLSDYAKGVVTARLVDELSRIARERGKVLVIDPKGPHFGWYRWATCVTPNKVEAEEASGVRIEGEGDLLEAGRRLMERWGSEMVLITRGEEGMSLFERGGGVEHIPAVAREVYDVTGAGDTVVSVFVLGLASGADPREAAYLANAAAGVVVGKLGAATVSREEILGQWELD